jgi:hypothetical protein
MESNGTSGEKLKKGDRVVIAGLQTTTEYNGKHATIVSIPKSTYKNVEKTRYGVEIDGVAEVKKIKLVHLSKIGESSEKHFFQMGDSVILRGLKVQQPAWDHLCLVRPIKRRKVRCQD